MKISTIVKLLNESDKFTRNGWDFETNKVRVMIHSNDKKNALYVLVSQFSGKDKDIITDMDTRLFIYKIKDLKQFIEKA